MFRARGFWILLPTAVSVMLAAGCGKSKKSPSAPGDASAPSVVADLAAAAEGTTSILLTWTAVGDDSTAGTAAAYDLR